MNRMDLRQVGIITGLPIYVDFDSIPDYKDKNEILSARDSRELLVVKIFNKVFEIEDKIAS